MKTCERIAVKSREVIVSILRSFDGVNCEYYDCKILKNIGTPKYTVGGEYILHLSKDDIKTINTDETMLELL